MDDEDDGEFAVETWRTELEEKRGEKDAFFGDHPQSPIPPEEREAFDGLAYFEPDPAYRVRATVSTHDDADPVYMETTAGGEMRYLRVATLSFDMPRTGSATDNGASATGAHELAAYQLERSASEPLFVPFRDKTTGQQTYRGGRYMELQSDRALENGERVVLDFNLAYTPFCAYTDTYDCPLPPEENWLDVAVPAGERLD